MRGKGGKDMKASKVKIIGKKKIKDLLREASQEWNVYVPQKWSDGDVWMDQLPKDKQMLDEALEDVVLEDVDTVISPKDIFFPQLESIFKFKDDKIWETPEFSPKLIFGVQPCDLKGILFSDDFYRRNFEDRYYVSRIQNRLIVARGCLRPPRPTCFCSSAKTGPFAEDGFDLQLVDFGDSYFVEVGTREGEEFITMHKKFFSEPDGNYDMTIKEIKTKACDSLELKVDFQNALSLMAQDSFIPEENYRRIGERCIYCGGCLYVCPTCTCFNVFDNVKDKEGERVRNWDACVFEGYTRETSGHNPRKDKWLRTARRYEHKLKFDYKVTGLSGCIACGRCLSSCPVGIGISKFIQEITEKRKIM
ncbi:MAG: 4Fe-4S dicluster domain-containing protein [Actinobacteria bacterium]|nr:4Fe-4S dicluster domain-containing protein [Actinomycetota bacterium]